MEEAIKLDEVYIMFPVPENTVSLTIQANIIDDNNEIQRVSKDISPSEYRQARKDFVENIGDDWNATYVLTEEGRKWLEELRKNKLLED